MNQVPRTARSIRGFTLIELMVVVTVVGILAAIAIPSYQESIRKGRRGQAKADLVELAQMLERFRTVNGSYLNRKNGGGQYDLPLTQSPRTGTAYYQLQAAVRTDSAFTLQAVPVEGGPQVEDRCGTLSINQAGTKTATGGGEECW